MLSGRFLSPRPLRNQSVLFLIMASSADLDQLGSCYRSAIVLLLNDAAGIFQQFSFSFMAFLNYSSILPRRYIGEGKAYCINKT